MVLTVRLFFTTVMGIILLYIGGECGWKMVFLHSFYGNEPEFSMLF